MGTALSSTDGGPQADQLAIPWTYEDFYVVFADRFRGMALGANWTGSGDDAEDLEQWLWMHFHQIWDKAQTWTEKTILTHARREIKTHAKVERIAYEEFRCEYVYDTQMVKAYLATCLWSPLTECPDVDARIDLQRGYEKLTPAQRVAIYGYYVQGSRYLQGSKEERAFSRGIKELVYQLNSHLPRTTASLDELADWEEI
jgi:hypothetical protein